MANCAPSFRSDVHVLEGPDLHAFLFSLPGQWLTAWGEEGAHFAGGLHNGDCWIGAGTPWVFWAESDVRWVSCAAASRPKNALNEEVRAEVRGDARLQSDKCVRRLLEKTL